jgi:hypothetical protein
MMFRAVNSRCAVDLSALDLPISNEDAVELLSRSEFRVISVDLIVLARCYVGRSAYRRGARLAEAPQTFDCSSLTKWLYAQRGIWLPRRSIQQRVCGEAVEREDIREGDLIFITGHINYYDHDPADGVGHVGIATGEGTVIHAANRRVGIVESSLASFFENAELRGIRRMISEPDRVVTFEIPLKREVETSDDFRWIILQRLPR